MCALKKKKQNKTQSVVRIFGCKVPVILPFSAIAKESRLSTVHLILERLMHALSKQASQGLHSRMLFTEMHLAF